jgi:tetratricopeptide (TPR) repeat protein
MRRCGLGIVGVLWAIWAAPAAAAPLAAPTVDIWSGGLASQCAEAARDGLSGGQYEDVCTEAIQRELLPMRDRAGTYVNRGILRLREKRYADATQDFDTAIRYQSSLGEAYVNRAAARIGMHQFKDSLSDVENALLLGVKEPQKAYYDRALAHEWLDDYRAAWADFQKAQAIAPDWELLKEQMSRFKLNHPIDALPMLPSLTDAPKP